jgi:hypothetical protein
MKPFKTPQGFSEHVIYHGRHVEGGLKFEEGYYRECLNCDSLVLDDVTSLLRHNVFWHNVPRVRYKLLWRRPTYLTLQPGELCWTLEPVGTKEDWLKLPIDIHDYIRPCYDFRRLDGTKPECHVMASDIRTTEYTPRGCPG